MFNTYMGVRKYVSACEEENPLHKGYISWYGVDFVFLFYGTQISLSYSYDT